MPGEKKDEKLTTESVDSGEKAVDSKEEQSAQQGTRVEAEALKATTETTLATKSELDLTEKDIKRLYKWGKETINPKDVTDIVSSLKDPYKSEIIGYIRKDDIE
jgi:hypothetical protein